VAGVFEGEACPQVFESPLVELTRSYAVPLALRSSAWGHGGQTNTSVGADIGVIVG
jgi:hypothetical protein